MALSSLAGAVVRGINHHGKPVAALTHSSARVGSVLIWLLHSVRSIGKHAGQAPRWLCPHPPGDLHGGGVGWEGGKPPLVRQSGFLYKSAGASCQQFYYSKLRKVTD